MLFKFAYQDFIEDRKFKNTTESNIKNRILLGGFISYCLKKVIDHWEYGVGNYLYFEDGILRSIKFRLSL